MHGRTVGLLHILLGGGLRGVGERRVLGLMLRRLLVGALEEWRDMGALYLRLWVLLRARGVVGLVWLLVIIVWLLIGCLGGWRWVVSSLLSIW